ncbi:MAG: geranylgeranyl reductase family protein [Calditrichaeota bacterium]|nr:MAG: geranylgeranyl reductase family protein [Calditrichota bacterium]
MKSSYDLIVVGAGPAGTTTALYAHRQGLRVLLIDKKSFPRDKVCGDVIPGRAWPILQELGLTEPLEALGILPLREARLVSPAGIPLHLQLPPCSPPYLNGFMCPRLQFDQVLFRAAAEQVNCYTGVTARGLLPRDDQRVGLQVRHRSGKEEVLVVPLVVAADGAHSQLARKAGLPPSRFRLVATRQYVQPLHQSAVLEAHFWPPLLPGYRWWFPLPDGRVNAGVGTLYRRVKGPGGSLRRLHQRAFAELETSPGVPPARAVSPIQGWHLPTPDFRRPLSADHLLLVGDAAALVDPFTGGGIGNAMLSGKLAARVARQALEAGRTDRQFLNRYDQQLWQQLRSEFRLAYRLQRLGKYPVLLNWIVRRLTSNRIPQTLLEEMSTHPLARRALLSPATYLGLRKKVG